MNANEDCILRLLRQSFQEVVLKSNRRVALPLLELFPAWSSVSSAIPGALEWKRTTAS